HSDRAARRDPADAAQRLTEPEVAIRPRGDGLHVAIDGIGDTEFSDHSGRRDPADGAFAENGKPNIAVGAGRDALRCLTDRHAGIELSDRSVRHDPTDPATVAVLGEPDVAVRTARDLIRPAVRGESSTVFGNLTTVGIDPANAVAAPFGKPQGCVEVPSCCN